MGSHVMHFHDTTTIISSIDITLHGRRNERRRDEQIAWLSEVDKEEGDDDDGDV